MSFIFDVALCTDNAAVLLSTCYQITEFGAARADFGTGLAISTRAELDPGDLFGIHAK